MKSRFILCFIMISALLIAHTIPFAESSRILRPVCVVADFPDSRLEDSRVAPLRSFAKIQALLDKMSEHWRWLNCGTQVMNWRIIRVEMTHNLSAGYPSWMDFRQEAVSLSAEQINFRDYDCNHDGVLDIMWIIGSCKNKENESFLCGGSARIVAANKRTGEICVANTFYDGQESGSVKAGAYGNFNHEICHCLGLPDLYGEHNNLSYLSIMSDSWPVPANGICAFDRFKLGFTSPLVVSTTTYGVELTMAETSQQCVKIPTPKRNEYFLIEYRQKPSRGFGSYNDDYHGRYAGLVIYHVDESRFYTGCNNVDPPLVALESAKGKTSPDRLSEKDFWYPGNRGMLTQFVGVLNDGRSCGFCVTGFTRTENGIRFDVLCDQGFPEAVEPVRKPNLLRNPSFEEEGGSYPGWTIWTWKSNTGAARLASDRAYKGDNCLLLSNDEADDSLVFQPVMVKRNSTYFLSGWVKTEGVRVLEAGGDAGANMAIWGSFERSESLLGDNDWTFLAMTFDTGDRDTVNVACRLGHHGSTVIGNAWFDRIELIELK